MVQAMKLKNILIVVNDIQESICFYKEILYLIFDYPYKHYTFKYFEV